MRINNDEKIYMKEFDKEKEICYDGIDKCNDLTEFLMVVGDLNEAQKSMVKLLVDAMEMRKVDEFIEIDSLSEFHDFPRESYNDSEEHSHQEALDKLRNSKKNRRSRW